jgi:hypothetical protein
METAVRSRRKIVYTVLVIVSIPVILIAALFAFATYVNWSAERKAAGSAKTSRLVRKLHTVIGKQRMRG